MHKDTHTHTHIYTHIYTHTWSYGGGANPLHICTGQWSLVRTDGMQSSSFKIDTYITGTIDMEHFVITVTGNLVDSVLCECSNKKVYMNIKLIYSSFAFEHLLFHTKLCLTLPNTDAIIIPMCWSIVNIFSLFWGGFEAEKAVSAVNWNAVANILLV